MLEIEIRLATQADLDGIESIYDKIHTLEEEKKMFTGWKRGIYPTRETAKAAIEDQDMYVELVNGKVVASGRLNQIQMPEYVCVDWECNAPDDKIFVLHTLVVDPDENGKGYASRFLTYYEEEAKRKKCSALRIDTNKINRNARAMYHKKGYTERGIVPCTFNGLPGVQLVILEKVL